MAAPRFINLSDDRRDQLVFFSALLGGVLLIGLLRSLAGGERNDGITFLHWLPLFAAVAVILLYVCYVLVSKDRTSISVDRAGDNAYYLGLIFTLFSLMWSLTALSIQEDLNAKRVLDLLPDFGLALTSTIVGIAARIFVQQFRHDPADIETQARYELGLAIRELRSSLLSAVSDMRNTSSATNVALQDMMSEITETISSVTKQNAAAMSGVTDNLVNLGKECADQVGAMSSVANDLAKQVKSVGELLNAQVKLLDIDTAPANEKLRELTKELGNTGSEINGVAENCINFSSNLKAISSRMESVFPEAFTSGIEKLGEESSKRLKTLSENALRLISSIEEQSRALNNDPIRSRLEQFDAGSRDLRQQLEELRNTVDRLRNELKDININDQLRQTGEEASRKHSELKRNLEALEKLIGEVTPSAQQLSSSETAITDYIAELRRASEKIRDASNKI